MSWDEQRRQKPAARPSAETSSTSTIDSAPVSRESLWRCRDGSYFDFSQIPRELGYLFQKRELTMREFALICWVSLARGDHHRPPVVTYAELAAQFDCAAKTIRRMLEGLRKFGLLDYEPPTPGSHRNTFVLRLGSRLSRAPGTPPRSPGTEDVSEEHIALSEGVSEEATTRNPRIEAESQHANGRAMSEDVSQERPLSLLLSEGSKDNLVGEGTPADSPSREVRDVHAARVAFETRYAPVAQDVDLFDQIGNQIFDGSRA